MPRHTKLAQAEFPPSEKLSDDRGNCQRTMAGAEGSSSTNRGRSQDIRLPGPQGGTRSSFALAPSCSLGMRVPPGATPAPDLAAALITGGHVMARGHPCQ